MVSVLIGAKRQCIQDVSGKKFLVYPMYDEKGGYFNAPDSYADCTSVDFKIELRRWLFWRTTRQLPLTDSLRQAIIKFLNHYHGKQDLSFDCYAFANSVHRVLQHDKHGNIFKFWDVFAFWEPLPKTSHSWLVGDTVFLFKNGGRQFTHAAVYLGQGLFVSVWGAGGELEAASLEDMVRDFRADRTFHVVPRPQC